MSTTARDKAWEDYAGTAPSISRDTSDAFEAGWDAGRASVLSALTEEDSRALDRRITAAIYNTSIGRAELQFELPECHKAKCQSSHPDGSAALSMMMRAISENVRREVLYRTVTMPDVADEDDPERAVLTLAALLSTYNVHDAGTYIRAAQLIIDAYPLIGAALIEQETTK